MFIQMKGPVWQRTLKKLRTLKKKKLGSNQGTLNFFSKCVKSVHQHYHWCKILTHFEKKYRRSGTLFSFNRWDI